MNEEEEGCGCMGAYVEALEAREALGDYEVGQRTPNNFDTFPTREAFALRYSRPKNLALRVSVSAGPIFTPTPG